MLYFTVKMMPMMGVFLVVQGLRLHFPNAGDRGSIPDQGTRSHTPQLRVCVATRDRREILHATTKTPYSQINFFFLNEAHENKSETCGHAPPMWEQEEAEWKSSMARFEIMF